LAFQLTGLKGRLRQAPSVRAVLLLSLVMILATVISAAAVLIDLRQRELDHARGEIVSLSQILSDQTARSFDGVALMMRGARERLADDFGRRFELGSDEVRLLLLTRSAGLPQVKSLFLVDAHGYGVNSSRPDDVRRLPMAEREFFKTFLERDRDELFIGRPEKARVDDQWAYYVSLRLDDGAGQLRGVLVAAISIDYFEKLYENITLDFATRILMLDHQGRLLAGKPRDETMFGVLNANPAALRDLLGEPADRVVIDREAGAGGPRFVAYHQVANYPLVISAAVDQDDALTPWQRVVRPIAAGAVLVVLLVSLATLLMARSLLRQDQHQTERRHAERQLLETNRQLQELSASLQNVREHERSRISRELHDELGQLLTGIRMEVSWLGGRLLGEQQQLIDKVASIKGQIDQTIASVRRISSELRPLVLDDLGFAAAASWYVDQFSARTGLPVKLVLEADDPQRGDAAATVLFRVLQESLTNVARHANATTVDVELRFGDDGWVLSIRDDGVGFAAAEGGGLGLVGMRERVQMLGGRFALTRAPGHGTLVEVRVPAGKVREAQ
jgi:signal transduction histidine kinase